MGHVPVLEDVSRRADDIYVLSLVNQTLSL